MRVKILSIPVMDQQHALDFYTGVLGFEKKVDLPLHGENRWLTVVSRQDKDGPELLLEPAPKHFEPSKVYQDACMNAGMPYTQFYVDDLRGECERLKGHGVEFTMEPTEMGNVIAAIFNDTCGNLIQLVEEK